MLLDSDAASGLRDMHNKSLGILRLSLLPVALNSTRTHPPPCSWEWTPRLREGMGGQDISLHYLRLLRLWLSWLFCLLCSPALLPPSTLGLENILVLRFSSGGVWERLRLPVFDRSSGYQAGHGGFLIPKSLLPGLFLTEVRLSRGDTHLI